ncbi:MAG: hypothetical protein ACOY71_04545 [Gemmatimonadota bacterium]
MTSLLAPAPAAAQVLPLGVPKGAVRLELFGGFRDYNERYRNGTRESVGADFTTPAAGSGLLPFVAASDARLTRVIGVPAALTLGATTGKAEINLGTVGIGAAVGVTKQITLFANLPFVRGRVQSVVKLDSTTGNAGFNPADRVHGNDQGRAQAAAFFNQFDQAIAALDQRIQSGAFDANPQLKAQARAALADARAVRTDLFAFIADPASQSPFVPTVASPLGTALTQRIAAIQTLFATSFGVGGFTAGVPLATRRLAPSEFDGFVTNPAGPVAGRINADTVVFAPGNVELGVVVTPIDRWNVGDSRGGFRLALRGLARLPTGQRARDGWFFDPGTTTGSTQVEAGIVADVGRGLLGLRASGHYVRSMAGTRSRRVAPPTEAMPLAISVADVRTTPGSALEVEVRPFLHVARGFSLQLYGNYWTQAQDRVEYAGAPIPGIDASVLARATKVSATSVGVGVTYSNLGRLIPGGTGLPVDGSWTFQRMVASSGGITPAAQVMRIQFRVYQRMWGK